MRYRRDDTKGGTWFFTVNLAERRKTYLLDEIVLLRHAVSSVKQRHPFTINAIVVLPDHIHAIWTLPEQDNDFSTRWGLIKAGFSRKLSKTERINRSRTGKGERGIWQRRYWEHLIRNERDYEQHVNYIHYNPVKHDYVDNPADWPYSSIHRYIRYGILEKNWSSRVAGIDAKGYGEPVV